MILDGFLLFTGTSNGNSSAPASGPLADAPTTGTQQSANIVDLGITSGVPSSVNGGGARDIGIGDDPMLKLLVQVNTAFADGTSLAVSLQGAPDDGTGAPGSWTTMWTSPVVLEAALIVGAYIANVDVPRTIPGQALPRFLRLQYVTVGTHTAGEITGTIALDRFDQIVGTTGALSGYPAGVTVNN
jgi:hypothetical protein